jgi:hypothetical protein
MKKGNDKKLVGVWLHKDDRQILAKLAENLRLSRSQVVGKLLREEQKRTTEEKRAE